MKGSTPAASTTIYIVINNLQETKLYVQCSYDLFRKKWAQSIGRNSSVSSNGETRLWTVVETLTPLFIRAGAGEGAYPSKPKCGTKHHTLRQRVNPTVPAASRKHRPWTGLSGVKHSFRSGVLIVAHQQAKPFRGQPFKPFEIETPTSRSAGCTRAVVRFLRVTNLSARFREQDRNGGLGLGGRKNADGRARQSKRRWKELEFRLS
jgi:hypothetical protein